MSTNVCSPSPTASNKTTETCAATGAGSAEVLPSAIPSSPISHSENPLSPPRPSALAEVHRSLGRFYQHRAEYDLSQTAFEFSLESAIEA